MQYKHRSITIIYPQYLNSHATFQCYIPMFNLMHTFTVEPAHVSPVFSIDTETGMLTVSGRGPYLDANGTSGILNV